MRKTNRHDVLVGFHLDAADPGSPQESDGGQPVALGDGVGFSATVVVEADGDVMNLEYPPDSFANPTVITLYMDL